MKINLLLDVYGHWSGCIFLASFLSVLNRQLYWCILAWVRSHKIFVGETKPKGLDTNLLPLIERVCVSEKLGETEVSPVFLVLTALWLGCGDLQQTCRRNWYRFSKKIAEIFAFLCAAMCTLKVLALLYYIKLLCRQTNKSI